jgi:hypothetical protein
VKAGLVHGRRVATGDVAATVSGASRERRPRDRPRKSSQRAWLLARALITLGTAVSAWRKPGRDQRTRTEAAASRGGESGARNGCARASFRYGRSRKFRFQPPGFVVAPIGAGTRARASRVGTPLAHFRVSESLRRRKEPTAIEEAYLRERRCSRRGLPSRKRSGSPPQGVALEQSPAEGALVHEVGFASRRVRQSGLGDPGASTRVIETSRWARRDRDRGVRRRSSPRDRQVNSLQGARAAPPKRVDRREPVTPRADRVQIRSS